MLAEEWSPSAKVTSLREISMMFAMVAEARLIRMVSHPHIRPIHPSHLLAPIRRQMYNAQFDEALGDETGFGQDFTLFNTTA
jgi:hypothetical protein